MTQKNGARPPGEEPVVATQAEGQEEVSEDWKLSLPESEKSWRDGWQNESQFQARIGLIVEAMFMCLLTKDVPRHAAEDLSQEFARAMCKKKKGPKDFEKKGVDKAHEKLRNYISRYCRFEAYRFRRRGLRGETESHRMVQFPSEDYFVVDSLEAWKSDKRNLQRLDEEDIATVMARLNNDQRLLLEYVVMGDFSMRRAERELLPHLSYSNIRNLIGKTLTQVTPLVGALLRESE